MKNTIINIFTLFLISGCSATQHLIIYESVSQDSVYSFFQNGIPVSSINTQEQLILFSSEETILFHKPYLRIWVLYKNKSETPHLIEPYNTITLHAKDSADKAISDYIAESPTKILDEINEQAATAMIFQAIGGTLKAMSTQGTTIKSNDGSIYRVNDTKEKQEAVLKQNQEEINKTADWYSTFINSINTGVLRKNTVFPGQSINGYIYFQLDNIEASDGSNKRTLFPYHVKINEVNFSIIIQTTLGKKEVKLRPTKVW